MYALFDSIAWYLHLIVFFLQIWYLPHEGDKDSAMASTKTAFFSLARCLHYPMMSFQCKHFDNEIELHNFSQLPLEINAVYLNQYIVYCHVNCMEGPVYF